MANFTLGAGLDQLNGTNNADLFILNSPAHFGPDDFIIGGFGTDALEFRSTVAATLDLEDRIDGIETITLTGIAALNVDASDVLNALLMQGNAAANSLTGTIFADNIVGSAGNDSLVGGGGADTLIGGTGIDSLVGGHGNDLYAVDSLGDVVVEAADDGTDTVNSTAAGNYLLSDHVEKASALGVTGGITANALANQLISGGGANLLDGAAGNDTLTGGAGADTLRGGNGDDLILMSSVAEFAAGERIDGGADADTLRLALPSGVAPVTITLTANVTNVERVEMAASSAGGLSNAQVSINASAVTTNGLTIIGSNASNNITGTAQNDRIEANGQKDTITGGAGTDTLDGGDGDDLFLVAVGAHLTAGERVEGGAGTDTLRYTGVKPDTLVLTDNITGVELVELAAGTVAINVNAGAAVAQGFAIAGNAGSNALTGGGGNDTLTGGAGRDTLSGGGGDDVIVLNSAAELAAGEVINGGDGYDILRFTQGAGTLVLPATLTGIEVVELSGTAAQLNASGYSATGLTLIGNERSNHIIGTSQNDSLVGSGLQGDVLIGGAGDDTIVGSAGTDFGLLGGAGSDVMRGGGGDDYFYIGASTEYGDLETIDGEAGTDSVVFTGGAAGDSLTLRANLAGVEQVFVGDPLDALGVGNRALDLDASAITSALVMTGNNGANRLTATDYADKLDGMGGNDSLVGGLGADTLFGGTGADTLIGGAGDDLFLLGVFGVSPATELLPAEMMDGGEGDDLLRYTGTTAAVLILGAGTTSIEAAEILATAGGVGTALAGFDASLVSGNGMRISGNGRANILTGTHQADTLIGGAGNDKLAGNGGADSIVGGEGADQVNGGAGADIIVAASLADFAADTVEGGADFDTLRLAGTTAGNTFVLAPTRFSGIEQIQLSDATGDMSGTVALNLDASGVFMSLLVEGNAGDNTLIGSAAADTLAGQAGDDSLVGGGGADVLTGGEGDDLLAAGAGNDRLNGGAGADTLRGGMGNDTVTVGDVAEIAAGEAWDGGSGNADVLALTGSGQTLDLTAIPDAATRNIEIVDLTGSGNNSLVLNAAEVVNISGATGTLRVDGNGGDSVSVGLGWSFERTLEIGGKSYVEFTNGDATLQVHTDVGLPGITLASKSLGLFSGVGGFKINGIDPNDSSGQAVGGAGDVNGDGFADLIIGAPFANDVAGESYVVFGGTAAYVDALHGTAGFNLSALDGTNGFRLAGIDGGGIVAGDLSGFTVAGAGDVNGDGKDDVIVAARRGDPGGDSNAGESYVVFGGSAAYLDALHGTGGLDLSALDGTNGFRLDGINSGDYSGSSVASAGDVNGDGYDDLIIGAYRAGPPTYAGESYVVFGKAEGFGASLDLSTLDGVNGLQLHAGPGDYSGISVASAGDVNGDGYDDLLIGASGDSSTPLQNGSTYIVFGGAGDYLDALHGINGFDLNLVDGTNGVRLRGASAQDYSGRSVSSAGDVNGDGFDDVIIVAPGPFLPADGGESFVVFGGTNAALLALHGENGFSLAGLNGSNGFRLVGLGAAGKSAYSVDAAGDVNGDGYGDLLIGVGTADSYAGSAYVVFGKAGGFAATIDLQALDGSNGYRLDGVGASDRAGYSAAPAGDVDGDGFDDFIIGARGANGFAGASYVVLGSGEVDFAGTAGNDTLTGNAGGNSLIGGLGDDTLSGAGGTDVLKGGAGADVLVFDGADRVVDGGSGTDTLRFAGAGGSLDLTAADDTRFSGIEIVDLTGSGNNSVTLDALAALNLSGTSNTLRIDGNKGDTVLANDGVWTQGDDVAIGSQTYAQYTKGVATLQVDIDVNRSGIDNGVNDAPELADANVVLASVVRNSGAPAGEVGTRVSSLIDFDGGGGLNNLTDMDAGALAGIAITAANASNGTWYYTTDEGENWLLLGEVSESSALLLASDGERRLYFQPNPGFAGTIADAITFRAWDRTQGEEGATASATVVGGHTAFSAATDTASITVTQVSVINLGNLTGENGFRLDGMLVGDNSGRSVAGAGDVDGDGYADVIIGAQQPNGGTGDAYVVFGNASGFGPTLSLSALDGGNGFRLDGINAGDYAGASVASAGDVNGDGFADLIVGALHAENAYTANDVGETYVVFGKGTPFDASIGLGSLDGATGFRLDGVNEADNSGNSVAGAGDVNGDGYADIIVGAAGADPYGQNNAGAAYVIYGHAGGFDAAIALGSTGFTLTGVAAQDFAGQSVAGAGDVNGDGYDDVIVGADGVDTNGYFSGAAYVVFGGVAGITANLGSLTGSNGFRLDGPEGTFAGRSVASAGDVNGDGFGDVFVGALYADPGSRNNAGAGYVVFGSGAPFSASLGLDALDGANGFRVEGVAANDRLGRSVASAGDVNGDGYDDLIVGADFRDAPGATPDGGATYIVFGKASGFGASLNLATLNGSNGFRIDGDSAYDHSGFSVSGAGDLNGDGFDDLIVGAYGADPDGNSLAGSSYVVFGFETGTVDFIGTGEGDSLAGNGNANVLVGGLADDTLDGGGGIDVLRGGAGNDLLLFDGADRRVDGGGGEDTLRFAGAGELDLTGIPNTRYTGIEVVDLANESANTLVLNARDLFDLSATTRALRVEGDVLDVVSVTDLGWVIDDNTPDDLHTTYRNGLATLTVGEAVTVITPPSVGVELNGTAGADTLVGTQFDDTLNGQAGADSMAGAGGNDSYFVDQAGDVVTELPGGGIDTVNASVTWTLGAEVENLTLTGSANLGGFGNELANVLLGNSGANFLSGSDGNDTLDGGAGADVIDGGDGDDRLVYDPSDLFIDGGGNEDTLVATGANVVVDLRDAGELRVDGIEVVDLTGSGDNTLLIDPAGLFVQNVLHVLRVTGDAGDAVVAPGGPGNWVRGVDEVIDGDVYAIYTNGLSLLYAERELDRSGIAVGTPVIQLSSLDGSNGFRLDGVAGVNGAGSHAGRSVAAAGDVNHDGFDDFIVGADEFTTAQVIGGGATYVVFGAASFGASLSLGALDGSNGFVAYGINTTDFSATSVGGSGDVDGDGFTDIIIGAPFAEPGEGAAQLFTDEGEAYVVFGNSSFGASLELRDLDGDNGIQLNGLNTKDYAGISVASAGDVNGDGYDDVLVGARDADLGNDTLNGASTGETYVVFGGGSAYLDALHGTDGFALSDLDGTNGFRLDGINAGDTSGRGLGAGDINGDGYSDILIGAPNADPGGDSSAGATYVVFGGASFGASLDLGALNGTNGFRLDGINNGDSSGAFVASAGDVNGDGYDDILIGATGGDRGGTTEVGHTYVVFGGASFGASLDLGALDGTNGFRLGGIDSNDFSGRAVASAGDVNGDGFDDILVGADGADPGGVNSGGEAYIVFGRDFRSEVDFPGTSGNDALTGTAGAENLIGGLGNDALDGAGGVDVLKGGGGDDVLIFDGPDRLVDGGSGEDILLFTGSGESLDLTGTAMSNLKYAGIEIVNLTGSGNNTLTLHLRDLLDLSDSTDTLRVDGDTGDVVNSTGQGWVAGGTVEVFPAVHYQSYTAGTATLLLNPDIVAGSTIT